MKRDKDGESARGKVLYIHSYGGLFFKDKSPEVPFHRITSSYSYFEEFEFFAPIHQEAKHDQEKISTEQK